MRLTEIEYKRLPYQEDMNTNWYIRFGHFKTTQGSKFGLGDEWSAELGGKTHESGISVLEAIPYNQGYQIKPPMGCIDHRYASYAVPDETSYFFNLIKSREIEFCKWLDSQDLILQKENIEDGYVRFSYEGPTSGKTTIEGKSLQSVMDEIEKSFPSHLYKIKIINKEFPLGHQEEIIPIWLLRGDILVIDKYVDLGSDGEFLLKPSSIREKKLLKPSEVYIGKQNLVEFVDKMVGLENFCRNYGTYG
ncbi:MAG: hypothetical protein WC284_14945 [Candidimonas sp.]